MHVGCRIATGRERNYHKHFTLKSKCSILLKTSLICFISFWRGRRRKSTEGLMTCLGTPSKVVELGEGWRRGGVGWGVGARVCECVHVCACVCVFSRQQEAHMCLDEQEPLKLRPGGKELERLTSLLPHTTLGLPCRAGIRMLSAVEGGSVGFLDVSGSPLTLGWGREKEAPPRAGRLTGLPWQSPRHTAMNQERFTVIAFILLFLFPGVWLPQTSVTNGGKEKKRNLVLK